MVLTGEPGFSIVVCCYNSEDRIPVTLSHIASLDIPAGLPCELLIINNASTDNTLEVVLTEWNKYHTPILLRVMYEPLLGLSYARKTGFEQARYNYIVWCDDDNWLSNNYLLVAADIFKNNNNIGIIGGCGEYFSDSDSPGWMQYSRLLFAIGPQAVTSGPVTKNCVYGAGAVIYKPAYDTLSSEGFRQLLTDRLGNNLASGGDYEICYAIALAGYIIWYEEELRFIHYFPPVRLSRAYFSRLIRESVPCLTTLDAYAIVLNGKTGYMAMDYSNYMLRHLIYFCKQIFVFFFREWITDPNTDYGFFIRMRTAFFRARFRGVFFNFPTIYSNLKKIDRLKNRLKS